MATKSFPKKPPELPELPELPDFYKAFPGTTIPVPPAAEYVPKVGDRVICAKSHGSSHYWGQGGHMAALVGIPATVIRASSLACILRFDRDPNTTKKWHGWSWLNQWLTPYRPVFKEGDKVVCRQKPTPEQNERFNRLWVDDEPMNSLVGKVGVVTRNRHERSHAEPHTCAVDYDGQEWFFADEWLDRDTDPAKPEPEPEPEPEQVLFDAGVILQRALTDAEDLLTEFLTLCPDMRDDRINATMKIIRKALDNAGEKLK